MQSKRPDAQLAIKRAIDLLVALLAIIVLSPVLTAIAAAVRLTSPGPAIYRGARIGRHGRTFYILKFRTMIDEAEQLGGPTTSADDPRVTPLGAFLRRYKLDELPQLWNVVCGEMSFVGPRPEVISYLDWMADEDRVILSLRPGITDRASLRFHDLQSIVGETNPESVYQQKVLPEKRRLQREYANNWSLWADLVILSRTVWLLLGKPLRKVS